MIIYSEKIVEFIRTIKELTKEILSKELSLKVAGNRFYSKDKKYSYPISVVIFDKKTTLGYFNSEFYELGFNRCLMHMNKLQLKNLIRHELAHYMLFIEGKEDSTPHGENYKAFCKKRGWGEEVYNASVRVDTSLDSLKEEEPIILRKVKKLMALATSCNVNEAEAAMIKSQQLLLKHNLNSNFLKDEEEQIIVKRVLKQKKLNAKLKAVAKILETFFVNIIFHSGKDCIYLEILGSFENVEIAEYVANILYSDFDTLWENTKKIHKNLKGQVAKNSFFYGIAKGYLYKVQALKNAYTDDTRGALVLLEKKLDFAKSIAYPRLSQTRSLQKHCKNSSKLGESLGKKLNIHSGINAKSTHSSNLISN